LGVSVVVEWICGGTSKRPSTEMYVVLDEKMWMCGLEGKREEEVKQMKIKTANAERMA
jgi:hypothetical protein